MPPTASCSQYYLLINASSIANPRCRTCSMLQFQGSSLLPDISMGPGRIGDRYNKTYWRQTYWRQIYPPTLLATVPLYVLATVATIYI